MAGDHEETFTPVPPENPAEVVELELRDGSRVWVRPIRPTDRGHLEHGMRHLSSRSRYMRFHSAVEELSPSQLDYLTDVDHHDHDALLVLDPDTEGTPGVAVARYIRVPDLPHIAEAAVTVADAYQGRGIGTALIGRLQVLARDRGITTFRNYVLAENRAMLAIFRDLGATFESEGASLYRVDVPIPKDLADLPDTPAGRLVRSVAEARPPEQPDWAFPLLWPLRYLPGVGKPLSPSRLLRAFTNAVLPTSSTEAKSDAREIGDAREAGDVPDAGVVEKSDEQGEGDNDE